MLLHEISRRIVANLGQSVTEPKYGLAVQAAFQDGCGYCRRALEPDRASVEHLDGMNRFRVGLHIPGNVIVACKRCNNAKRPDDQNPKLHLAASGWESFLSHDRTRCATSCKTCAYWQTVWPDEHQRQAELVASLQRIRMFREVFANASEREAQARVLLKDKVNDLYRACQASAQNQIQELADTLFKELG